MCRIKRSLYDDFTTIDVDFALHGRNWIVKANDCGILRITEKQVVVPVRGNKKRHSSSIIAILFKRICCHGNICRSTMAEFVMRDMVARAGLGDRIAIASCATTNDEIGNDTHPGTQRVLDAHGIAHPRRAAVKLRAADYDEYDLFIGMDDENIRDMRRILKGDPQGKVHKLLEYSDGGDADSANSVADPWFTGDFETTYEDVVRGCEALLAYMR